MKKYNWKPDFEYDKVYLGGCNWYVFKEKGFTIMAFHGDEPECINRRIGYAGYYHNYDETHLYDGEFVYN